VCGGGGGAVDTCPATSLQSRRYAAAAHVGLHLRHPHVAAVENTSSQGCLHPGGPKHCREVRRRARATGRDDGDGDRRAQVCHEADVKPRLCAVGVDAVHQQLTGPKGLARLRAAKGTASTTKTRRRPRGRTREPGSIGNFLTPRHPEAPQGKGHGRATGPHLGHRVGVDGPRLPAALHRTLVPAKRGGGRAERRYVKGQPVLPLEVRVYNAQHGQRGPHRRQSTARGGRGAGGGGQGAGGGGRGRLRGTHQQNASPLGPGGTQATTWRSGAAAGSATYTRLLTTRRHTPQPQGATAQRGTTSHGQLTGMRRHHRVHAAP
jgi:hypothetical protein